MIEAAKRKKRKVIDKGAERNLLQMDYNKMMKFIENPITRNIIADNKGHIDLAK